MSFFFGTAAFLAALAWAFGPATLNFAAAAPNLPAAAPFLLGVLYSEFSGLLLFKTKSGLFSDMISSRVHGKMTTEEKKCNYDFLKLTLVQASNQVF